MWECFCLRYQMWRARVMREQTIKCPDSIVLACQCGEWIVLIGRIVDWYEEDRLEFSCDCGRILTLSDRMPDTSDRLQLPQSHETPLSATTIMWEGDLPRNQQEPK